MGSDKLSQSDIQALLQTPSSATKIAIIKKLSVQYKAEEFTSTQVALAEQIFRLLLKHAEVEVRTALAENLMNSRTVPHDVVIALANDIKDVALPVLEFSEVLNDADLIRIIESTREVALQLAVTRRSKLSEPVSSALVATHNEQVVESLIKNDGAAISEPSYMTIINEYRGKEQIVETLLLKQKIPEAVLSQMTKVISEELRKKLEYKYQGSFKDINDFFKESGEIASVRFHEVQGIDEDLLKLIDSLEEMGQLERALDPLSGQLTQLLNGIEQMGRVHPMLALERGHKTLFEIMLSRQTGVPISNVRKLVANREEGFHALYDRAQLPSKFYDAVVYLLNIMDLMDREHQQEGSARAKDDLFGMIQRAVRLSKGKEVRNLAHIIAVIRRQIGAAPRLA